MSPPKQDDLEQVRQAYNCDLNFPGEIFPPRPVEVYDKNLVEFHQRLQEIVERRDSEMALEMHNLIKENPLENRYFFAVGYSKRKTTLDIIYKLIDVLFQFI